MSFEVTFDNPLTLNAGQVYYLNFENEASNGKAFYLEYASDNTYDNGTYHKAGSDDEKDTWFQVWGGEIMYISYEKIYSLTLSPDSKRVAYGGEDDNREVAVVDGEEQRWYEKIYSLTFSPLALPGRPMRTHFRWQNSWSNEYLRASKWSGQWQLRRDSSTSTSMTVGCNNRLRKSA